MKVGFKNSFLKALQKLKDEDVKNAIYEAILDVEKSDSLTEIRNIKKLKGYTSYFRIRVGNHRIGIKWEEDEKMLYFVTFDHRKDIYKKFP
ncbi:MULTISPECIES: type II toxin-antitoxin system RelE/ParE family toxin [Emticicia]|uniref:type II toxin-antitoxin system RelE family toxin n=1 Tax=Emticicia TaxID=312278 RepID=UPI0007D8B693|nr:MULTISPECIES: type II toxin-antitoxin system RelE/ParE family toxin [Emticicia]